ncbi:MAG: hypothetical protein WC794_00345 [Candidatus Doudnabacteria bacterium]|jgi:hypothetical protein
MIDNLEPKPDMWEANPKLKMLSLVFIFVFLFSGIALVVFSVWSNQYRQKIYEETVSSLPKHEVRASENQKVGVSDIANWKTYKNDQYGFELKYPESWDKIENDNGVDFGQGSTAFLSVFPVGEKSPSFPTSKPNTNTIYINDKKAVSKQWEYIKGKYLVYIALTDNYPASWNSNNEIIFYLDSSKVFLVNDILSTFKFTNSADTSNWKTYKNDQYGFEFMHPADFVLQSGLAEGFIALAKGPDTIGAQVLNKKFDPKKIENLGGIVEDAKQVKVGDQIGYMYGNGDGPWISSEVETVLGNKTLRIGFQSYVNEGSSPDGVGVLYEDNILINKILSTFKFTK